ncbi:LETM1 domain-containing protein [Venturia nashicola]|uniref:LETM1 domain-containing protein n=1 Tax=Venturia nashicola TaxID=86259 RepID=A0A4Z1P857_9PEZI|nr:LETM1 domain-containing protein [Venturia nashicola]
MDKNFRRQQLLIDLGITQLPTMTVMTEDSTDELEITLGVVSYSPEHEHQPDQKFSDKGIPIHNLTLEAHKCPGCLSRGKNTWVQPGKMCPVCSTCVE